MRKDIILTGLAAVGGALGLVLRWRQLATAYDPNTQLFLHGQPTTYLLLILLAVLALAFLLLLRNAKGPEDFLSAFRCPSTAYMTLMAASALLFLGAGVLGLLEGMAQLTLWRIAPETHLFTYPLSLLLCSLLALAAGLSTLMLGKGAYRGEPAPACSLLAIFSPLAALVWLFATHLAHGTDPVLMGYGFFLAAIALLLLAHYYVAAFFHGRPHPRRTAFCALLGSALGILSLTDGLTPFQMALTAAFVLSALASVWALLRNVFGPPWPKRLLDVRMPLGAQEETEDAVENQTED